MKLSNIAENILLERSGSEKVPIGRALSVFNKHCNRYSPENQPIYRGIENVDADYLIVDPTKYKRSSISGWNQYTLLMDNTDPWKAYPKRSRSHICSTLIHVAQTYAHDGNVYHVIPFDGAKFGVCPNADIYQSFKQTIPPEAKSALHFNMHLASCYKNTVGGYLENNDWNTFKVQIKELGEYLKNRRGTDIGDLHEAIGFKKAYIYLGFIQSSYDDLMEFLVQELINPTKNRFRLETYPFNADKAEVWTESKALFVNHGVIGEFWKEIGVL